MIAVTVEVARGGLTTERVLQVEEGTLVRAVVRSVGVSPEGCAVLVDGVSVPRDLPVTSPIRLTIVPTFSGG
jgi:sulfur carrier protein ThiS